jgi:hypothetical protein
MFRRMNPLPSVRNPARSKSGQALLESFGVILLLCLILFGMVQLVLMMTATEMIQFSADSAVRAKAVGLNEFMASKVSVIASIPNSGARTAPNPRPGTSGTDWENQRNAGDAFDLSFRNVRSRSDEIVYFPGYLETLHAGQAMAMLNYERSAYALTRNGFEVSHPRFTYLGALVRAEVSQEYPLTMPLFRTFSERNSIRITGSAELAHHAELYLE